MSSLLDRVQTAKSPEKIQIAETPPAAGAAAAPALAASEPLQPGATAAGKLNIKLRQWLIDQILLALGKPDEIHRDDKTLARIHERFAALYKSAGVNLTPDQAQQLERDVVNELVGFGPIEPLLDDPTITEVMVNGPDHVYIEQKGRVLETPIHFDDEAHVYRVIDRIIRPLGRRVDRKWPMVDARLPDGSRVNVIIPPSAIDGPTLTIRKFSKKKLQIEDLMQLGSLTPPMSEFLHACVVSRLNIIVSGGTGSGKTTLLNVLSNFIPEDDRIVTIEDSAELHLAKPHVVRLEARPPDPDGTGRVTIRDLVVNSLRMRPERIIVGEVRGPEAFDLLQAMNTGHDGSMGTLHANSPREALSRLESMITMGGFQLPTRTIREMIVASIDVIIQAERLRDGSRRITHVTEVIGMEGEVVITQDLLNYDITGEDEAGRIKGTHVGTGIVRPAFWERARYNGLEAELAEALDELQSAGGLR